jgi:hypothetical protein
MEYWGLTLGKWGSWRGVKLTIPPSNTALKKKSKYTSTPSNAFTA